MKWIGLAKVRARPGSDTLGVGRTSAFVTIIAEAASASDFTLAAQAAFAEYDLALEGLDDREPLHDRRRNHSVDPVLLKDAEQIPSATSFVFGDFHTYPGGDPSN
jgi:hypothetical protein